MTITTVIYDFGQVLIGWDPWRVWRQVLAEDEIEVFLSEIDFHTRNQALDAGTPFSEVLSEVAAQWPQHAPHLQHYWNNFSDSLTGPIPGSYELVKCLKDDGYRLLGLTNWSAETIHHAHAVAPAVALMDAIVVSGEVGMIKPDPKIFHYLLDTYSMNPQNAVFIDDSHANVEAARQVGLAAIQFRDVPDLREELSQVGVSCS